MRLLVIGGGAAGMMAAVTAAENGCRVTVIERNARPARKVMITGKGRCNVTNHCTVQECVAHIPGNGKFLYGVLSRFGPEEVMDWFTSRGVPLKTERGGRVFPVSDRAVDIVDCLTAAARRAGVQMLQGRVTALLTAEGACTGVRLEDGRTVEADAVAVCTGGMSYPVTGSTGDGYALAEQAGHRIVPPRASLVPVETAEYWPCRLQGLSLKNVTLTLTDTKTGKKTVSEPGEILFTHFGVSGPLVLTASALMREPEPNRYTLLLDLKPGLTVEKLDARLVREFAAAPQQDVAHVCESLMPRRLIGEVLALAGFPPHTKCSGVTREQRRALGERLKALTLTVAGTRPIEEAIVTAGGVDVREIDARTMASKKLAGLYFAGEVLDADAFTGGFNLQIAFSTGHAVGAAVGQ